LPTAAPLIAVFADGNLYYVSNNEELTPGGLHIARNATDGAYSTLANPIQLERCDIDYPDDNTNNALTYLRGLAVDEQGNVFAAGTACDEDQAKDVAANRKSDAPLQRQLDAPTVPILSAANWANVGNASPDAAWQTLHWAFRRSDTNALAHAVAWELFEQPSALAHTQPLSKLKR